MHQRDYILRIIEQLGAVLAELRRIILGQKADPAEIQEALADAAGQVGLDIELLRGFDLETLRLFVMPAGELEPARCWLMAELLYLDGLDASLSDAPARESLLKARALFEMVRPAGGMLIGFPEASERIAEIDRLLGEEPGADAGPGQGSVRYRRVRARAGQAS